MLRGPYSSYVFPFEPNPMWSKFYAGGEEIKQYMIHTADKYNLRKNIVFNMKLIKANWHEEQGKWKLQLDSGTSIKYDEADVFIDAKGILNHWDWPRIPGLHSFKGEIFHSAKWDPNYDWEGKRVAVIGNGSSGLQLVPALQPKAAKLVNYARHSTWVSMNLCGNLTKDGMGTNFEFTEEEKQKFRDDPEAFLEYRKVVERSVNSVFRMMVSGSEENAFLANLVDGIMRQRLNNDPELVKLLIPDYEVGCRRLSPGDGYLEALQANNARPCFSPIRRITPSGIVTDEGEEEFDLIVCATGFVNTFVPPWEQVGRNGRRLDVEWDEIPEAYFSVCAAGMPNYFMFAGPNCPIGHGSVPQMLAWTADYALDWVEKIATEDIKSVVVKDSVVRDYNIYAQENLKRCVWSKGCHAWYSKKNDNGKGNTVTAMYPGSALHYKGRCHHPVEAEDMAISLITSCSFPKDNSR